MTVSKLYMQFNRLSCLARLARTAETQAFYETRCLLAMRAIFRAQERLALATAYPAASYRVARIACTNGLTRFMSEAR